MTFERWDVIVVAYPFLDVLTMKRRPALVVSSAKMHLAHGVGLAAMITTARRMTDVRVDDIVVTNVEEIGLRESCVIRMSRLMTIELTAEARRIGGPQGT